MTIKKKDTGKQLLRAEFIPGTFDAANRSVDVVFATVTPVLRYSWTNDEYFYEILDMGGADLSRTAKGLPVLDNHGKYGSVGSILGRANNIRLENGEYVATIKFSKRGNIQGIIDDIQDGIITDTSFGYTVTKYERMEKKENATYRDYVARKWQPNEISFVTIPADPKAGVRSETDDDFEPELIDNVRSLDNTIMTEEEKKALRDAERNRAAAITKAANEAGLEGSFATRLIEDGTEIEAARTAINAEKTRIASDPIKARAEGAKDEHARSKAITEAVKKAGLPEDFARTLVDDVTCSIDQAREKIITKLGETDSFNGSRNAVQVGNDRGEEMERIAVEASLVLRVAPEVQRRDKPAYNADQVAAAREFKGHTLLDLAKRSLTKAGENLSGLSKMEIVGRAFTNSTSDFPVLLEGTNRRILLDAYAIAADTWRQFCRIGSVSDFREYKRLRMGTMTDLELVNENGEFKNKKYTDADFEKISATTKGNIINVTRQMIINDDLSGFTTLATQLGRAAARTIENDVYRLLLLNAGLGPLMQDGKTLFHADHGNISADPGAPLVTRVENDRVQMAKQKDKDGNDFLDIRPSLVLTSLSNGAAFRILNSSQYDPDAANKLQRPNIVNGLFSTVIDSPRMPAKPYIYFADPNQEPVMEVVFLEGQQEPFMENRNGFTVDGTEWKIRIDHGVGAIGYKGALRNAGE